MERRLKLVAPHAETLKLLEGELPEFTGALLEESLRFGNIRQNLPIVSDVDDGSFQL
jgi:hypothetical protein